MNLFACKTIEHIDTAHWFYKSYLLRLGMTMHSRGCGCYDAHDEQ